MSQVYVSEPPTSGKVVLHTTVGDIEIELFSRECPLACRNFVALALNGYYNDVIFNRCVKGFMAQTGDPTGTGYGGESIYGRPFPNEIHQRLKFTGRGVLAMAGPGNIGNDSEKKDMREYWHEVPGEKKPNWIVEREVDLKLNQKESTDVETEKELLKIREDRVPDQDEGKTQETGNDSQFFMTFAPSMWLNGKHTIFGKIVGDTIFNLLRLDGIDTDDEDKPLYEHKINTVSVLSNPFSDLVGPAAKQSQAPSVNPSSHTRRAVLGQKMAPKKTHNINLVSFGVEEDIGSSTRVLGKIKSLHDVVAPDINLRPHTLETESSSDDEGDSRNEDAIVDDHSAERRLSDKLPSSSQTEQPKENEEDITQESAHDVTGKEFKREKRGKRRMAGSLSFKSGKFDSALVPGKEVRKKIPIKLAKGMRKVERETKTLEILKSFKHSLKNADRDGDEWKGHQIHFDKPKVRDPSLDSSDKEKFDTKMYGKLIRGEKQK